MNPFVIHNETVPSRPGDPNTYQWSHDVGIRGDMPWQPYPYEINAADNNIQRPAPVHYQPMTRDQQPAYHPTQTNLWANSSSYPENPRALPTYLVGSENQRAMARYAEGPESQWVTAPYPVGPENQQAMGPYRVGPENPMTLYPKGPATGTLGVRTNGVSRPMGPSVYSSVDFPRSQLPVLTQLHPSNEQLCDPPEVHSEMPQGLQYRAPQPRRGSLSTSMAFSPSNAPAVDAPQAGRRANFQENAKSRLAAFSRVPNNVHVKPPSKENPSTPTASPNKKNANFGNSPGCGKSQTENRRPEKRQITSIDSPTEKRPKSKKPTNRGVRFISASVPDVLRWRENRVFNDVDRCNTIIEIFGTVFDLNGVQPVKISVYSQSILYGIFWETDLKLDRNAILPGSLVRVVLRITPDGDDFHFLKVTPTGGSVANMVPPE